MSCHRLLRSEAASRAEVEVRHCVSNPTPHTCGHLLLQRAAGGSCLLSEWPSGAKRLPVCTVRTLSRLLSFLTLKAPLLLSSCCRVVVVAAALGVLGWQVCPAAEAIAEAVHGWWALDADQRATVAYHLVGAGAGS